jgi:hypothetical protein
VKPSLWNGAVRAWEEGGPPQLVMRAANRLTAGLLDFGSVTFFRRPLAQYPLEAPVPAELTIHPATLIDRRRVLEGCDPRRPVSVILERLRRGDVCFLAQDAAGRVMHSDWVTTTRGHVPELQMDVVLRPGEAYLYDAYTPPALRGQRLFGIVLDAMFASLRCAGVGTAYSYVRGDTPVGLERACRRLQPIGSLWYGRFRAYPPVVLGSRGRGFPILERSGAARDDDGFSGFDGAAIVSGAGVPPVAAGVAAGGAARILGLAPRDTASRGSRL